MLPIKVGVIGLGFMGATHIAAYREAGSCELVAVCDPKAPRRRGELGDVGGNLQTNSLTERAFDPAHVRGYERAEDLLNDANVQLVSICTRTDTHVRLAAAALRAGKHVLVEKPVSLSSDEIRELAAIERESGKFCVPAHCMRFWPGWSWLRHTLTSGALGECHSLSIQRLAAKPSWSSFFSDGNRSGGALADLHVHDTDFVTWCFGTPRTVSSTGRLGESGEVEHLTTLYRFDRGPQHCAAEGGWDHAPAFGFRMRYVAVFEQGTVDFDLDRNPRLLVHQASGSHAIELPDASGYQLQIRALLRAIDTGDRSSLPTLEEAAIVADVMDCERASVLTGGTVDARCRA